MKKMREAQTFDELLDSKYGELETEKRDEFEAKAKASVVGELIKEARKEANLTQEQWRPKQEPKRVISPVSKMGNLISSFSPCSKYLKKDWI